MSADMSACLTSLQKPVGLDHVFYEPNVYTHVHRWSRHAFYAVADIPVKVTEGFAGSKDATAEFGEAVEGDLLYTTYIHATRPAIRGVYDDNPMMPYPTTSRSKRKILDKRAMETFARGEDDDLEDEDPLSKAELIAAGVTSYLRRGGATGVRMRMEIEEEERMRERTRAFRRAEGDLDAGAGAGEADAVSRQSHRSVLPGGGERSIASRRSVAETTIDPRRQKHYAYFVPGWIRHYVQQISLSLSNKTVDTLSNDFIAFVYHDIGCSLAFKQSLAEMTEDIPEPGFATEEEEIQYLIGQSSMPGEAWLPIPFDHCLYKSKALNLGRAIWAKPTYTMSLAPLTSIIKRSDKNTSVVKANGMPLAADDIKLEIVANVIVLSETERRQLGEDVSETGGVAPHPEEVENTRIAYIAHDERAIQTRRGGVLPASVDLRFTQGLTASVHWTIRRKAAIEDNDRFDAFGLLHQQPMKSCEIQMAGRTYQPRMSASYWRTIQSTQKGVSPATRCCYHWGIGHKMFTEYPESSLSLVKYPKVTANIEYQEGLDQEVVEVRVYRRAWYMLRYEGTFIMRYGYVKTRSA